MICITLIGFHLVTHDNSAIPFGQPKTVTCQIYNINCGLLNDLESECDLRLNWIARVKSDGYTSHSLVTYEPEEVVQNLQYIVTTNIIDLILCDTNVTINASFSIDFFDIGPYEEVLVSCGLTVRGSFKLDDTVVVLTQGECCS